MRATVLRIYLRIVLTVLGFVSLAAHAALPLEKIELPANFAIEMYASNVEGARSLALGRDGTVYVGSATAGKVYALVKRDPARPAEVVTVATALRGPNGVSVHDNALYVAETHRIIRFPDIARQLRNKPTYEVVYDKLPTSSSHGRRVARFGPDGKLYYGIGAPCNICKPDADEYAVIRRIDADGGKPEVYARGVRNTVGFDWHPQTKELWFTDNGRDRLGDDIPPDELNHAARAGMHFGYPYCHGGDIADPEFGQERTCKDFAPPAVKLGPHVASLGMRFYTGEQFPARYRNGIFIAEHGSWNRSVPIGYRVTFIPFENGKPAGYEVFAQGWLQSPGPWGRPVDVLVMPDGALLVSDDHAGVVYRITYRRPQ